MNYFDSDPILCLDPLFLPLPQAMRLIRLLNQKLAALNVLIKFWQSEILMTDLNVPNVLQMLEKHYQQVNDLSTSCFTVLSDLWSNAETIEKLIDQVHKKCCHFCSEIALPANIKLRQML